MNEQTQARRVRVLCTKSNGTRVLFKDYPEEERGQARIDRDDALRGFGINAVIEGEADPIGEAHGSAPRP